MPILPNTIVRSLEPYHSPGEGRYDFVRLDFNENTRGITEAYPDSLPETWVSAYPEYGELTQRLAEFYKVDPESILLTNGSDEGLSVIASTFIESGQDMAVVSTPCFTMISHYLRLAGAKLIAVPVLADLSFDLKGIEDALKSKVRLAMFDTPVNPTGAILDPEQIRNWCKNYPDTLFVIDEAYGEFAGKSSVSFITEFDNLLVTKTFSKAWAMAGLRLGMVFGQPQLIEYLNRVKSPYSVNSAAVWTASRLLEQADKVTDQVNEIMADKQSLLSELSMRSFEVVPGSANSFLLSMGFNAQQFVNYCKSQGILVRNRSINNSPLWGKVRVSIGTPEENKKFLQTLDSFCAGYGLIFDIDGTLVDTSSSFDSTVHEIVLQYSGVPLAPDELRMLRASGGYNDDWVAAHELLNRRGVKMPLAEVAAAASKMYLELAPIKERLLIDVELIQQLKQRYPLFVVTGRPRKEYMPIWADRLDPLLDRVYCLDDVPDCQAKPAPDYLLQVVKDFNLTGGVYIGDSVDDMQAACAAGLDCIGITTIHASDVLCSAGAQLTLTSVNQLKEVFIS